VSGHKVPGLARFAPKEGVNFDCRLNLNLHSDEVELIDARKREDESRADWIRMAIRKELLRTP
jgi:hypothetical protein